MQPAGFLQRCAAWTLDAAVLVPASLLLAWPWLRPAGAQWRAAFAAVIELVGERVAGAAIAGAPPARLATGLLHDPALREAAAALHTATWLALVPGLAMFAILGAVWNVGGECARWRGSGGKRMLGLQVGDRAGRTLTPGRALARHVAGAASWATLNLGHALAIAPPEHLALHDRLAGTRVLATRGTRLPRWAAGWLVLVSLAAAAGTLWLAGAGAAAASAALDAGLQRLL